MKTTVPTPVSSRDVKDEKAAVEYLNKEVRPILREIRSSMNAFTRVAHELETAATGAFATIWTSDALRTNSDVWIEARVMGRASAGAAQHCAYQLRGLFYNQAGTVAQQGSTSFPFAEESAAACNVQFLVSGQTVLLQVRDDGASTFQWRAIVDQLPSLEQPA